MTRLASTVQSTPPARRYGPAVGEPPLWADPRRGGSLIGLAGGLVFIGAYSPTLGHLVSLLAWIIGATLAVTALTAHYLRPVPLGPLTRPSTRALLTYGACVIGELALINLGSRALTALGHGDLRPALIATVVGLHFIPFAWAFGERMFSWLGGFVAALGATGLAAGVLGSSHAAEASAVTAGLTMLAIITVYAAGRFAPSSSTQGEPR